MHRPGLRALLLVFVALVASVALQSYADPAGRLSPDSHEYLRAALNLIRGHGLAIGNPLGARPGVHFATWPAGYPLLIAGVESLLHAGLFWSAKLANCLALGLCLALLHACVRERAWLYACALLTAPGLAVFPATWSEAPFICCTVGFALCTWMHARTQRARWLAAATALGVSMFCTRYVGLHQLAALALLAVLALRARDVAGARRLLVSLAISGALGLAYLATNLALAGHPTGVVRGASQLPVASLAADLALAHLSGLNLITHYTGNGTAGTLGYAASWMLMGVFYLALIGAVRARPRPTAPGPLRARLWFHFALVAGTYWVSLVLLRFMVHFDSFGQRLMAPAILMALLAAIAWLEETPSGARWLSRWLPALALAAFVHGSLLRPAWWLRGGHPSWPQQRAQTLAAYEAVPRGSTLITDDYVLRFLRPDLRVERVFGPAHLAELIATACDRKAAARPHPHDGAERVYVALDLAAGPPLQAGAGLVRLGPVVGRHRDLLALSDCHSANE